MEFKSKLSYNRLRVIHRLPKEGTFSGARFAKECRTVGFKSDSTAILTYLKAADVIEGRVSQGYKLTEFGLDLVNTLVEDSNHAKN